MVKLFKDDITDLGEKGSPDGFDVNLGGRQQGVDLVGSDFQTFIGKDEGGVSGSKFGRLQISEGFLSGVILIDRVSH